MPVQLSGFLETDLINMVSGGLQAPPVKKVKRKLSAKKVSFNKEKVQKRGSFSKDKKSEMKRRESVDMGFRIRHFIDGVEEKFMTKHKGGTDDVPLHRNNSARLRKLIEKDHPEISRSSKTFSLPKANTLPALFGRSELIVPDLPRSRRGSFREDSTSVSNPLGDGRKSPLIILPDISQDRLPLVVVSPSRSRRMSISSPNRLSPTLGLEYPISSPRRGSCSPTLGLEIPTIVPRSGSCSPIPLADLHSRDSLSVHHTASDKIPKIRLRGRSASMWDVSKFEEDTADLRVSSGKRARSGRLRPPPEWGPAGEREYG